MSQIDNLELVLDVYDDGTIEVAPPEVNKPNKNTAVHHHHHHLVQECCSSESCQPAPEVEKIFERLPEDGNVLEVSSSDESEPELVELVCPCRCDGCHGRRCCHGKVVGGKGGAKRDEVVVVEADIRVKVPMKKKHFERLVQMARICQGRLQ